MRKGHGLLRLLIREFFPAEGVQTPGTFRQDLTLQILNFTTGEKQVSECIRKIPLDEPCYIPVDAVLPSRRNNRPEKKKGIKGLSVYNPVHYQELPELFMDFYLQSFRKISFNNRSRKRRSSYKRSF